MNFMQVIHLLIPFGIGIIIGACVLWIYYRVKVGEFHNLAASIIQKADSDGETLKKQAELEAKVVTIERQKEIEEWKLKAEGKLHKEEERLAKKEETLEKRLLLVENKLSITDGKEANLSQQKEALQKEQESIKKLQQKLTQQLEHSSNLSKTQAKALLLEKIESEIESDYAHTLRRFKQEKEEEADQLAARVISTALNRMAISCVSEGTIFTLTLPNEEMKGRIIGREGRNIRTLEQLTGVNFVIDDTPHAVILSGFDPIRRFIAKSALEELISDGRIHPTRIEEAVRTAQKNVEKKISSEGQNAALKAGVHHLHPELLRLLGKLSFRYSYGQNVLEHSLEVSTLMGLIAGELNLDVNLAKRIGLLHDMGKALTHEIEGTHAIIGHDYALKYGESPEVAVGIGCHHNEMTPNTIEGSFCSAADTLSAARPGSRVEAVEHYIQRLKSLEEISNEFPGVDKAFAMQAGREVRVVVKPELVDDDSAIILSRTLAKTIQQRLTYPGKIKVTVIREKRAVEYAV